MFEALRRSFSAILNPIPKQRILNRCSVAALAGILAILLRWILDPILGHVAFYVTVYIAVVYCAIVCGDAPAILAAAVGFVGIFYWFVICATLFIQCALPRFMVLLDSFLSACSADRARRVMEKQLRLNETVVALTRKSKSGSAPNATCVPPMIS